MNNKSIKLFFIGLAGVLCLTAIAYAVDDVGLGLDQDAIAEKIEKGREALYDKLNLTPEQREQLQKHREVNKGKAQDIYDKIKTKRQALKEELDKYESNERTVKQLTNDINSLQGDLMHQRVNSILNVKKILTLEQYEQLQTLEQQRINQLKQQRQPIVPPSPKKKK